MKSFLLTPFVLIVTSVAMFAFSPALREATWLGWMFTGSFVGCLVTVPVISRKKLWLGYAALAFPFVMAAATFVFLPMKSETVVTVQEGKLEWTNTHKEADILREIESLKKKQPNQRSERNAGATSTSTPPAGVAHP